jgi:hypothetical protein
MAALVNAKALAFVLADQDTGPLQSFLAEAAKARQSAKGGPFAFGRVGRSSNTTAQLAIHITSVELQLIESQLGGVVSQALGLVYRELYRVFERYLVDLFDEIATRDTTIFGGVT